jgi:hypothetical protein
MRSMVRAFAGDSTITKVFAMDSETQFPWISLNFHALPGQRAQT